MARRPSLKIEALKYARAGFRVFPVKPMDKRPPLTTHGFKDATTNVAIVERWWDRTPNANIAVATGGKWAVVDVDPRNGGQTPDWVPDTWTAETPTGGEHFWLRVERPVRTRVLAPGVDLKAEGGYVLVPPSRRREGEYRWTHDADPAWVSADTLEDLGLRGDGALDGVASAAPFEPREVVGLGERHDELTRWARYYRGSLGWDYDQLLELLMEVNDTFDPPMDELEEVAGIARWASRLRLE